MVSLHRLALCFAVSALLAMVAFGCGKQRVVSPDGACQGSGCDGGGGTLPDHNKPPPDGTTLPCTTYPNGIPTMGQDGQDATCQQPNWAPGTCTTGKIVNTPPPTTALHICLPNPIQYAQTPPSGGHHRGEWGKWGEYSYMPPQRWLHNLEHGGIAFLYHPCAPKATVDALRAFAKAWPADDGGEFRWVMTPYPGLPTAVAVVAWGWSYSANCLKNDEITTFIKAHYRKAPEDVGVDGTFQVNWMSK